MNENRVTKYKNEINSIPMRKWTIEEMDFFFAILTKLKGKGTQEVVMSKHELANLADYTITHNKRYEETMERLGQHIQSLNYWEKTKNSFITMPLFTRFKATWSDDLSELEVRVKAHEDFEYMINNWDLGEWTAFQLKEFTSIRSTYSKTLFRLLKQWRTIGKVTFSIEQFRTQLSIPDSYSIGNIDNQIIQTTLDDLKPFFNNLKVHKEKANSRGNPVTGYIFTFKPEKTEPYNKNKYRKQKKETLPNWSQDDKENGINSSEVNDRLERLKKLRQERK